MSLLLEIWEFLAETAEEGLSNFGPFLPPNG